MKMLGGKVFTVVYSYSLLLGALYNFAYWNSFNINIIPYVGLVDLLKFSINPLFFYICGLGVVLAIIEIAFFYKTKPQISKVNYNDFITTKFAALVALPAWTLSALLLVLYLCGVLDRVVWVGILFLIPIYLTLKRAMELKFIKNDSIKSLALFLVLLCPWVSYDQGKADANRIIQNKSIKITSTEKISGYKYLGFINGYVFMSSMSNEETLILDKPGFLRVKLNQPKNQ